METDAIKDYVQKRRQLRRSSAPPPENAALLERLRRSRTDATPALTEGRALTEHNDDCTATGNLDLELTFQTCNSKACWTSRVTQDDLLIPGREYTVELKQKLPDNEVVIFSIYEWDVSSSDELCLDIVGTASEDQTKLTFKMADLTEMSCYSDGFWGQSYPTFYLRAASASCVGTWPPHGNYFEFWDNDLEGPQISSVHVHDTSVPCDSSSSSTESVRCWMLGLANDNELVLGQNYTVTWASHGLSSSEIVTISIWEEDWIFDDELCHVLGAFRLLPITSFALRDPLSLVKPCFLDEPSRLTADFERADLDA